MSTFGFMFTPGQPLEEEKKEEEKKAEEDSDDEEMGAEFEQAARQLYVEDLEGARKRETAKLIQRSQEEIMRVFTSQGQSPVTMFGPQHQQQQQQPIIGSVANIVATRELNDKLTKIAESTSEKFFMLPNAVEVGEAFMLQQASTFAEDYAWGTQYHKSTIKADTRAKRIAERLTQMAGDIQARQQAVKKSDVSDSVWKYSKQFIDFYTDKAQKSMQANMTSQQVEDVAKQQLDKAIHIFTDYTDDQREYDAKGAQALLDQYVKDRGSGSIFGEVKNFITKRREYDSLDTTEKINRLQEESLQSRGHLLMVDVMKGKAQTAALQPKQVARALGNLIGNVNATVERHYTGIDIASTHDAFRTDNERFLEKLKKDARADQPYVKLLRTYTGFDTHNDMPNNEPFIARLDDVFVRQNGLQATANIDLEKYFKNMVLSQTAAAFNKRFDVADKMSGLQLEYSLADDEVEKTIKAEIDEKKGVLVERFNALTQTVKDGQTYLFPNAADTLNRRLVQNVEELHSHNFDDRLNKMTFDPAAYSFQMRNAFAFQTGAVYPRSRLSMRAKLGKSDPVLQPLLAMFPVDVDFKTLLNGEKQMQTERFTVSPSKDYYRLFLENNKETSDVSGSKRAFARYFLTPTNFTRNQDDFTADKYDDRAFLQSMDDFRRSSNQQNEAFNFILFDPENEKMHHWKGSRGHAFSSIDNASILSGAFSQGKRKYTEVRSVFDTELNRKKPTEFKPITGALTGATEVESTLIRTQQQLEEEKQEEGKINLEGQAEMRAADTPFNVEPRPSVDALRAQNTTAQQQVKDMIQYDNARKIKASATQLFKGVDNILQQLQSVNALQGAIALPEGRKMHLVKTLLQFTDYADGANINSASALIDANEDDVAGALYSLDTAQVQQIRDALMEHDPAFARRTQRSRRDFIRQNPLVQLISQYGKSTASMAHDQGFDSGIKQFASRFKEARAKDDESALSTEAHAFILAASANLIDNLNEHAPSALEDANYQRTFLQSVAAAFDSANNSSTAVSDILGKKLAHAIVTDLQGDENNLAHFMKRHGQSPQTQTTLWKSMLGELNNYVQLQSNANDREKNVNERVYALKLLTQLHEDNEKPIDWSSTREGFKAKEVQAAADAAMSKENSEKLSAARDEIMQMIEEVKNAPDVPEEQKRVHIQQLTERMSAISQYKDDKSMGRQTVSQLSARVRSINNVSMRSRRFQLLEEADAQMSAARSVVQSFLGGREGDVLSFGAAGVEEEKKSELPPGDVSAYSSLQHYDPALDRSVPGATDLNASVDEILRDVDESQRAILRPQIDALMQAREEAKSASEQVSEANEQVEGGEGRVRDSANRLAVAQRNSAPRPVSTAVLTREQERLTKDIERQKKELEQLKREKRVNEVAVNELVDTQRIANLKGNIKIKEAELETEKLRHQVALLKEDEETVKRALRDVVGTVPGSSGAQQWTKEDADRLFKIIKEGSEKNRRIAQQAEQIDKLESEVVALRGRQANPYSTGSVIDFLREHNFSDDNAVRNAALHLNSQVLSKHYSSAQWTPEQISGYLKSAQQYAIGVRSQMQAQQPQTGMLTNEINRIAQQEFQTHAQELFTLDMMQRAAQRTKTQFDAQQSSYQALLHRKRANLRQDMSEAEKETALSADQELQDSFNALMLLSNSQIQQQTQIRNKQQQIKSNVQGGTSFQDGLAILRQNVGLLKEARLTVEYRDLETNELRDQPMSRAQIESFVDTTAEQVATMDSEFQIDVQKVHTNAERFKTKLEEAKDIMLRVNANRDGFYLQPEGRIVEFETARKHLRDMIALAQEIRLDSQRVQRRQLDLLTSSNSYNRDFSKQKIEEYYRHLPDSADMEAQISALQEQMDALDSGKLTSSVMRDFERGYKAQLDEKLKSLTDVVKQQSRAGSLTQFQDELANKYADYQTQYLHTYLQTLNAVSGQRGEPRVDIDLLDSGDQRAMLDFIVGTSSQSLTSAEYQVQKNLLAQKMVDKIEQFNRKEGGTGPLTAAERDAMTGAVEEHMLELTQSMTRSHKEAYDVIQDQLLQLPPAEVAKFRTSLNKLFEKIDPYRVSAFSDKVLNDMPRLIGVGGANFTFKAMLYDYAKLKSLPENQQSLLQQLYRHQETLTGTNLYQDVFDFTKARQINESQDAVTMKRVLGTDRHPDFTEYEGDLLQLTQHEKERSAAFHAKLHHFREMAQKADENASDSIVVKVREYAELRKQLALVDVFKRRPVQGEYNPAESTAEFQQRVDEYEKGDADRTHLRNRMTELHAQLAGEAPGIVHATYTNNADYIAFTGRLRDQIENQVVFDIENGAESRQRLFGVQGDAVQYNVAIEKAVRTAEIVGSFLEKNATAMTQYFRQSREANGNDSAAKDVLGMYPVLVEMAEWSAGQLQTQLDAVHNVDEAATILLKSALSGIEFVGTRTIQQFEEIASAAFRQENQDAKLEQQDADNLQNLLENVIPIIDMQTDDFFKNLRRDKSQPRRSFGDVIDALGDVAPLYQGGQLNRDSLREFRMRFANLGQKLQPVRETLLKWNSRNYNLHKEYFGTVPTGNESSRHERERNIQVVDQVGKFYRGMVLTSAKDTMKRLNEQYERNKKKQIGYYKEWKELYKHADKNIRSSTLAVQLKPVLKKRTRIIDARIKALKQAVQQAEIMNREFTKQDQEHRFLFGRLSISGWHLARNAQSSSFAQAAAGGARGRNRA